MKNVQLFQLITQLIYDSTNEESMVGVGKPLVAKDAIGPQRCLGTRRSAASAHQLKHKLSKQLKDLQQNLRKNPSSTIEQTFKKFQLLIIIFWGIFPLST